MLAVYLYLVLVVYVEWFLLMKLFNFLLKRAVKMKKLAVLLTFCWVLLVSQILALTSLYYDGLQDIPGTPSVITLVDHQHSELNIESKLEENIEATLKNISHQLMDHGVDVQEDIATPEGTHNQPEADSVPLHPDDKIDDSGGGVGDQQQTEGVIIDVEADVQNITSEGAEVNLTEENPMPVFSEWAQKQMAEAEKKLGENVNASAMKRNSKPTSSKMPSLKPRAKNYAAPDCGAKIIASNPEAQSTGSVLTAHKDEYLLNPCTSKIWFVVELCEPIQAERVELANFELFSSSPKEFSVSVSNRFPTREWSNVGQFVAKDERDVQSFNLHPHLFGKFVRVEIHSHYNSEHYCPVSLFRVYGTSEFEAFETDNTPSLGEDGEDDEEEITATGQEGDLKKELTQEEQDSKTKQGKNPNNILKSAGEAVMNIVKKAAEALGKGNEPGRFDSNTLSHESFLYNVKCFTVSYQPLCISCSPEVRERLEMILRCQHNIVSTLLNDNQIIRSSFEKSQRILCANFLGFQFDDTNEDRNINSNDSILNWFPPEYQAAFCNIRAYEKGLIKPIQRDSEKTTATVEQPTDKTEPLQNTPDRSSSEVKLLGDENQPNTVQPQPPDDTKPLSPPEDVNIFNLPEEARVEGQTTMGEKKPSDSSTAPSVPPSGSGDEIDQQDPTGGSLLSNGSGVEDIDEMLLLGGQSSPSSAEDLGVIPGGIPTLTSTTSTTPMPPGVAVPPASGGTPPGQKGQPESVFLRLSNRIKALERNMSLSGQYLEELSRRYRKQVEELQTSYAKTLHDIDEQNRRMRDSELMLRAENERLREDFVSFREAVLGWRNLFIGLASFTLVQIVIVCTVLRSCRRTVTQCDREGIEKELAQLSTSGQPVKKTMLRRKSIDGIIGVGQPVADALRKKRPSEEALNITGTYENLLINEGGGDGAKPSDRKKSRNKHRKVSAHSMTAQHNGSGSTKRAASVEAPTYGRPAKTDLFRTDSAPEPRRQPIEDSVPDETSRIEDIPILEDNDEFIIPSASDLSYNEFVPDSTSETVKTNGLLSSSSSIDSRSTTAGKSGKGRRLSSPAFFKSSLLRSSINRKSTGKSSGSNKKSSPSQNVSSASSNTSSSANSSVKIDTNLHPTINSITNNSSFNESLEPPVDSNENKSSNGWEWYRLKKSSSQDKFAKRKAKSVSPETEILLAAKNGTTADRHDLDAAAGVRLKSSVSYNGSSSSSSERSKLTAGGSSGGSFRRLFRKVF
ncbi:uncharacterized protein LOC129743763 isoform X2 [Uranotaenia lowii]|uniref:uncharacterized protein LOC129743763 isoform X2 n=1 Tax=Uranotaenia lowii TaxID=190385 RepID=UPI00247AD4EF|nr:uncharacterized protein LOC129743763 isoform X2 [Uranotaenia lowii]